MSVSPQWANYWEKPESRLCGYVKDHPGSSRPHVTDANDDAYNINEIQDMPFKNTRMLQGHPYTQPMLGISPDYPESPPCSQYLMHAWDILGWAVAEIDPSPAGLEDLLLHLQIKWANIRQRKITKLMRSMNSRVHTCIAAQGGPTHYETDRILAWPHMGSVSHGGCITHSMMTIITWNVCWDIKLCYRNICYMYISL